jgi:hypothetical protein
MRNERSKVKDWDEKIFYVRLWAPFIFFVFIGTGLPLDRFLSFENI